MSHERFTDALFEARWQPDVKPEFHRGENKQRRHVDERISEAKKTKQIRIELLNMPVFAVEVPDSRLLEKPKPKELDTGLGFLEIIEMILEMIVEGAKAVFKKGKVEKLP